MKYYCEDAQQVLQELNSQKSGRAAFAERSKRVKGGEGKVPAAPVCRTGGRSDDCDSAGGSGHQRCTCSSGK